MTAPPFECARCGGFDPRCPRCVARRAALEAHPDVEVEADDADVEPKDDPAGGDERSSRGGSPAELIDPSCAESFSVEGDAGVLAGLPKARP